MKSPRNRAVKRALAKQYNAEERKFIIMMEGSDLFTKQYEDVVAPHKYQKALLRALLRNGFNPAIFGMDVSKGMDATTITRARVNAKGQTEVVSVEKYKQD